MLDGQRCIGCGKCNYISQPNPPQKSNWVHKLFLALIIFLVLLLFLLAVGFIGVNIAHSLIEEPTDYAHTSPTKYGDTKEPVPYYDSGFYVYTYQDNPATCNNGQCPKSEFAYI